MVGREITQLYPDKLGPKAPGRSLLSVRGLSDAGTFAKVDLELREGEILGIGGLIGAGRSEIAQTICGLRPATAGTVAIDGRPQRIRNYSDAVKAGLVYLSEDRKGSGVFLDMPISANISALDLNKVTTLRLVRDYQPNEAISPAYERRYSVYGEIHQAMTPIWQRIAAEQAQN